MDAEMVDVLSRMTESLARVIRSYVDEGEEADALRARIAETEHGLGKCVSVEAMMLAEVEPEPPALV